VPGRQSKDDSQPVKNFSRRIRFGRRCGQRSSKPNLIVEARFVNRADPARSCALPSQPERYMRGSSALYFAKIYAGAKISPCGAPATHHSRGKTRGAVNFLDNRASRAPPTPYTHQRTPAKCTGIFRQRAGHHAFATVDCRASTRRVKFMMARYGPLPQLLRPLPAEIRCTYSDSIPPRPCSVTTITEYQGPAATADQSFVVYGLFIFNESKYLSAE